MSRRLVVFLRGINLGHRRVRMGDLRSRMEEMGLEAVVSQGASGNVAFDDPGLDLPALETRIEEHLEEALGLFTDAMVRGLGSVERLTRHPTVRAGEDEGLNVYLTFAKDVLDEEVRSAFSALETPDDRFHVLEREVVWLRRGGVSDSTVQTRHLEEAFGGMPNTRRKVTTLRKVVEKAGR